MITWHQCWSIYTGYLSNTESIQVVYIDASNPQWMCTTVLGSSSLCNQSLNPVVDQVWSPPTLLTTSNVTLELNSVNGVFSQADPAVWNSLPDSIKLTTDTNRPRFKKSFKNSSLSPRVLTFVSAPGHFVSRALFVFVFISESEIILFISYNSIPSCDRQTDRQTQTPLIPMRA